MEVRLRHLDPRFGIGFIENLLLGVMGRSKVKWRYVFAT